MMNVLSLNERIENSSPGIGIVPDESSAYALGSFGKNATMRMRESKKRKKSRQILKFDQRFAKIGSRIIRIRLKRYQIYLIMCGISTVMTSIYHTSEARRTFFP